MSVNLAELADPRLARVLRRVPILSRLQKLNVLFCSLPGSPGEKSLALTQPEESALVLSMLDGLMHDLAKKNGIDVIVYKEFRDGDLCWMTPLLAAGYRRIPSPPMHVFGYRFADFKQYCTALKTRYRQQINRSVRKIEKAGIAPSVLSDTKEILERYTPEVHTLYQQMVAQSDVKLEVLPIEYFRQIALKLGSAGRSHYLIEGFKIVAFGWALRDRSTYHLTYAGVDYSLNHEFDLYFNLMYAGLDRALRDGFETINVGQTAATFKARIGCENAPRYVFAKGLGPVISRLVYYGSSLLLVQMRADGPLHIFKSDPRAACKPTRMPATCIPRRSCCSKATTGRRARVVAGCERAPAVRPFRLVVQANAAASATPPVAAPTWAPQALGRQPFARRG